MAKQIFTGTIVSTKMQSTVVVEVTRRTPHPMYRKLVKKSNNIKADTNGHEVQLGQTVVVEETRPLSKGKFFKVVEVKK